MTGNGVSCGQGVAAGFTKVHTERRGIVVTIPLGSFNLSGGVKVLVVLANGMAARGWRIKIIAPDFAYESPFPLDSGVDVKTVSTGIPGLPLMVRKTYYYMKLVSLVARESDICVANYFLTAYCAVLSRWLINRATTVIYYIQGYEAMSHGLIAEANPVSRVIRYLLARLSYRLPAFVICVSRWVCERIGRADGVVAYAPALDLSVFRPQGRRKTDSSVVIGTIGRKGKTKGYDYFLKALELLPRLSNVRVLIASPTMNEVPLPRTIPAEGIQVRTEAAMADFYNRCDIFVLPSLVEGFPLPPLEAMACGCVVVATACGGVADYAQDGVNCLIVPPGDPHALAKAVWMLSQDLPLRARLIGEGIGTAKRFEKKQMMERFLDLVAARVDA